ncbi:hypothetical protein ACU686_27445 [Yinghuangia aomiensis]
MRDDPELIHVVIHALNEWLQGTRSFNYQDRIFTTPVITLPIVEKAIEEPGRRTRAEAILVRPAPVPGHGGSRSFGLPEFDPFWERVDEDTGVLVSRCIHRTAATAAAPTTGRVPSAGISCLRARRVPDGRRMAADPGLRGRARLPRRALPLPGPEHRGDRERRLVGQAAPRHRDLYKKRCRTSSSKTRSRSCAAKSTSAVLGRGHGRTVRTPRRRTRPVRSDYPHPEGLADPVTYISELQGMSDEHKALIMSGNLARLMKSMGARTLPELVRDAADRLGDAEAVVDGPLRLTFAELSRTGWNGHRGIRLRRHRQGRPRRHMSAQLRPNGSSRRSACSPPGRARPGQHALQSRRGARRHQAQRRQLLLVEQGFLGQEHAGAGTESRPSTSRAASSAAGRRSAATSARTTSATSSSSGTTGRPKAR